MTFLSMPKIRIVQTHTLITLTLITLITPFFTGCATAPKEEAGPVFYPPLPNPPRIQYLHTFSNEYDLGDDGGSLGQFLLGEDRNASPILKPYGLDVQDGRIYVTDTVGKSYLVFDLKNRKLKHVLGSGGGSMGKPINITVDEAGNKYVADTTREQVLVYDINDKFIRAYGQDGQFKPTDVALAGDKLYVCDIENHKIHVLDKASGESVATISSSGDKADQIFKPTNIDIAGDQLYIADTYNARVQIFKLDGTHVGSIGQLGANLGNFTRPKGVSVDKEGRIYVVDAAFQNVQIFDSEHNLLLFFGTPGDHPENLNLPSTVVVDYDNIEYFQPYADPNFKIEYVILVASQYGYSKINAYGFGKMEGMDYTTILPDEDE